MPPESRAQQQGTPYYSAGESGLESDQPETLVQPSRPRLALFLHIVPRRISTIGNLVSRSTLNSNKVALLQLYLLRRQTEMGAT